MGAIDWRQRHQHGSSSFGFDDGFLVVETARYDAPEPHWRAFCRGEQVNGPFDALDAAQVAAGAAYERRITAADPSGRSTK